MKHGNATKPSWPRRLGFPLAVVGASILFTYFYSRNTWAYGPGSYDRLASFTAEKQFQIRILVPLLAKAVQQIVPGSVSSDLILQGWCVAFVAATILGFGCLMRALGNASLPRGAELFILLPVYWDYAVLNWLYYPYDMAALAFYCWAIVLYLRRKFVWFYVVYALGVMNRESICFATMTILAIEFRWPGRAGGRPWWAGAWDENKNLIYHCAAQSAVWFVIISAIEQSFRNNPGAAFHMQPDPMLDFVRRIWTGEPHWAMHNPRMFLTLFLDLWLLIPLLWRHIPKETRRLLWLIPPFLVIVHWHANMMETRIYGETNIVIAAAALAGINGWVRAYFRHAATVP